MASSTPLSVLLLILTLTTLLLHTLAQTPSAPAPAPSGPINITAILEKGGQYATFIRFITETQVANQINNQVNTSTDGMTVFAPTDNAFNNLPSGTLNKLSEKQHVQLIQYHVLPKHYTLQSLTSVSNPVRTQASGQDGGIFGLNFTGNGNQVNVSTGMVDTFVNNALRQDAPLAVYQVDKVLLPVEFYQAKAPAAAPPAANGTVTSSGSNSTRATEDGPSPDSGSGRVSVGLLGLVGLFCMGLLM